jgi:endoglucanase Acf2
VAEVFVKPDPAELSTFPALRQLVVVVVVALSSAAHADVVKVGAGAYLTTRPKPCKSLPDEIYKTADLEGATPTGQWWSSLVWQPYSQAMFAHPLKLRCTENGFAVTYPGAHITANKSGIFGSGSGKHGDLEIGHSAVAKFPKAECGGYSDWFVTAVFASGSSSLRSTFGHGSPFVFCEIAGGDPTVRFESAPKIWSGTSASPVLGITSKGHHYGLFGATGSTWSGLDGTTFVNDAKGKNYFAVAVLPDDEPKTLALFRKHAYGHVTGTRVEYSVKRGTVKTTYHFAVTPREGRSRGTLFALYPHQWKYVEGKLTEMTYGSVRGVMKVGEGTEFTTSLPVQGVLPMLPADGIADRDRMLGYLRAEADRKPRGYGDTYWEGKNLGKLATLSGVAEAANAPNLQEVFVKEIQRRLEEWFTARQGKDQPVFYYDESWGSLIGSRPSYGSDRPLNDHHFHYGYFIRAAAEVARLDPKWAAKWGPMVKLLIRDIASPDRRDAMFPFLRCFDRYAGHSWASGDANFGDGNNQESSSESTNAWYGMILWGQATGDKLVRDTGIYLYNTERTAVEEYWFDVSGTNFPKDFPNVALGMVWGGKGAFGTWFSGEIDCIHGINWLPFTPASLYMGRHPDYVKKNHDRILSVRKGGDNYNTGWGDLVCMFGALSDPDRAAAFLDGRPNCKLEGGNTHAFMYHWIHTLKILGLNDAGVTADHPLVSVFTRGGRRTYAAYNGSSKRLTVKFSDGTRLTAKPRTLTVRRGRAR